MAARRPITLEGNVQQGSVLLWIIRRLHGERFSLSEAAAICVPAISAGLYITARGPSWNTAVAAATPSKLVSFLLLPSHFHSLVFCRDAPLLLTFPGLLTPPRGL